MSAFLEIHELKKHYGGKPALNGLSMSVPDGCVAAFVGANGAGKTTTFSLISGFFRSNGGEIKIDGKPLKKYRRHGGVIGLLPQDASPFENRTLLSQLELFARLAGFGWRGARQEALRVLELVELIDKKDAYPGNLSHGMKMRFGVAQALVGNPPLILLDEPTAGLDPRMVSAFRDLISKVRGSSTIIISSHDLGQLELMCDYLCIIDHGKVLKEGQLREMLLEATAVRIHIDAPGFNLAELELEYPQFRFALAEGNVLSVAFDSKVWTAQKVNSKVLPWLISKGAGIISVDSRKRLEEVYLEETEPAG